MSGLCVAGTVAVSETSIDGRCTVATGIVGGIAHRGAGGAAWGRDASATAPVGDVRVPVAVLCTEGDELRRHVVVGDRAVRTLELVAWVLGKVGRTRDGGSTVDGGKQDEVTTRVVDLTAANRDCLAVLIGPNAVVRHPADEALFEVCVGRAVDYVRGVLMAGDAGDGVVCRRVGGQDIGTDFAAQVAGEREGHLVDEGILPVEILQLEAVVRVGAGAVGVAQGVVAHAVVVGNNVDPASCVFDLSADSGLAVEAAIGLPTVDEPGFDLEVRGRKDLSARAVEEPGRVGGDERRLIGPVIELVEAEEADVRQEDSGIDVDTVQFVPVVSAIHLRDVAIGAVKVPLPTRGAAIVTRRGLGVEAELAEEASVNVIQVEVSAYPCVGDLNLLGTEDPPRSADGVVFGMIEVEIVVGVDANLRREVLGRQRKISGTG